MMTSVAGSVFSDESSRKREDLRFYEFSQLGPMRCECGQSLQWEYCIKFDNNYRSASAETLNLIAYV